MRLLLLDGTRGRPAAEVQDATGDFKRWRESMRAAGPRLRPASPTPLVVHCFNGCPGCAGEVDWKASLRAAIDALRALGRLP